MQKYGLKIKEKGEILAHGYFEKERNVELTHPWKSLYLSL